MAATDARPVPRKNTAFRHYFAVRNSSTGALITSWTGADSEVSIDGAAYSDCTNEATEIGTSGTGYIDLTSSEMNGDAVLYKLTLTNTNALPYVVTFFPEESGDYRLDEPTLADSILKRSVATIESTAAEHSLATMILAALEWSISGTTLTVKRTDGSTTHYTKTLTTDAAAEHITAVT